MEVTIIRKIYLTEEFPDDLSQEELETEIRNVIEENSDVNYWDTTDYQGCESYEAYDTYSGLTVLEIYE